MRGALLLLLLLLTLKLLQQLFRGPHAGRRTERIGLLRRFFLVGLINILRRLLVLCRVLVVGHSWFGCDLARRHGRRWLTHVGLGSACLIHLGIFSSAGF